jgi:hypothetical protein
MSPSNAKVEMDASSSEILTDKRRNHNSSAGVFQREVCDTKR